MPIEKVQKNGKLLSALGLGQGVEGIWGMGNWAEIIKSNKPCLSSVSKENRYSLPHKCKQVSQAFDIKYTCVHNYTPDLGGDSVFVF